MPLKLKSYILGTMKFTEQQLDKYIRVTISLIVIVGLLLGGLYFYYYKRPSLGKQTIVEQQIGEFQKKVKKNPRDPIARIYLAQVYLKNNDADLAIRELKEAIKLDGKNQAAHYLMGYSYTLKGRGSYGLAKNQFKEVVKLAEGKEYDRINPNLKSSYFYLGQIAFEKKQYKDALKNYTKSSEIGSKDSDAFRNIGRSYLMLKDYKNAEKYLKEALKFVPNYAEAYVDLGKVYVAQNNKAKARTQYNKALEYQPGLKEAQEALESL